MGPKKYGIVTEIFLIRLVSPSPFLFTPKAQPEDGADCFPIKTDWEMSFDDIRQIEGRPYQQMRKPDEAPVFEVLTYHRIFNGISYELHCLVREGEFDMIDFGFMVDGTDQAGIDALFEQIQKAVCCHFAAKPLRVNRNSRSRLIYTESAGLAQIFRQFGPLALVLFFRSGPLTGTAALHILPSCSVR